MLTKVTVEAALSAEPEHHLGYQKNEKTLTNNSRNGYSSRKVKTDEGSFQLDTPRDRNGSLESEIVKKY
jgi:transposase-like protein